MTGPDPNPGNPLPVTLGPGHFRAQYAASADPWGLAERWYESRKYALSLALLPTEHYGTAFEPGGNLLAVDWRHPAPGHPATGDTVHQALDSCQGLVRLAGYQDPDFIAGVYTRADGDLRSVAQAEGIL